MMAPDHYTCAACGRTFRRGRPMAEAEQEAKDLWGVEQAYNRVGVDMAEVCEECFRKAMGPEN